MPVVPVEQNRVGIADVNGAKLQAGDLTGTGLQAVGAGLEKFGHAGSEFAEAQDHIAAKLDDTGAKTLDNDFVTQAAQARADFFSKQGLNAAGGRAEAEQNIRSLASATLARAKSPRMHAMVSEVVGQRVASVLGEFYSHATSQLDKAEDQSSIARQTLAGEEAAATTDPIERKANIATGLGEIASRGRRLGLGEDATKAEGLKFVSGVHGTILQQMVTADNLDGAVAYHTAHAGEMTASDNLRVGAMLRDPLQRRETLNDAALALGEPSVAGSQPNRSPVATPNAMFATIKSIESNGHQTNASGAPLTSSKGAVGIAQVMPTTGPEAAKLAGLPWDASRFQTDGQYNAQLGQAYFNKQLQTFGDPLKAAAAYNAGPGRLQSAISQAQNAGHPGDWKSYLPKETQAYVSKFQNGVGSGVQQQPERHDLNATLARVDSVAEQQGWTPERRDRAKQEVMRRVGIDEQLQNRVEEDAQRRALDAITNLGGKKGGVGFTDISQLPADVRANLSPSARLSLMTMAQENAKAALAGDNIKADGPDAFNLHRMAQYDPETFKRADLGMYQNKVTPGEMESLAQLQGQMRTKPFEGTSQGKIWGQINRSTPDLGFDLSEKTRRAAGKEGKIAPDQQKAMAISRMMKTDLDSQTGGTREPTDDEVQRSYDRAVRHVVVNGDVAHPMRAYEILAPGTGPATQVPDMARQQISQAYLRRYNRLPNEGEIARTYAARTH